MLIKHFIFCSHKKDVEYARTPYMVITHCAKSLSVVYNLFQDFDLNKDSDVSKVFITFINRISYKFVRIIYNFTSVIFIFIFFETIERVWPGNKTNEVQTWNQVAMDKIYDCQVMVTIEFPSNDCIRQSLNVYENLIRKNFSLKNWRRWC